MSASSRMEIDEKIWLEVIRRKVPPRFLDLNLKAFDAGYRRYEWKCDALNLPSRRAAARLGFSFEGVFRQHLIVKDRNRDTAWFSVIDSEWPALSRAFTTWLAPANFDAAGRQRSSLSDLTRPLRACDDPALRGQTG